VADVPTAGDLPPDAERISEVANSPDAGADRAVDLNQAVDSLAAIDSSRAEIDGAGPDVDGSGGSVLDAGVDSSAVHDGGGAGG
jgi:hypothetical protein